MDGDNNDTEKELLAAIEAEITHPLSEEMQAELRKRIAAAVSSHNKPESVVEDLSGNTFPDRILSRPKSTLEYIVTQADLNDIKHVGDNRARGFSFVFWGGVIGSIPGTMNAAVWYNGIGDPTSFAREEILIHFSSVFLLGACILLALVTSYLAHSDERSVAKIVGDIESRPKTMQSASERAPS